MQQSGEWDITTLLTSVNQTHQRVSMHGVRNELLIQQAQALGLPLTMVELPDNPSMAAYEATMMTHVRQLKQQRIDYAVFGDIFLEDLRTYRENQLRKAELQGVFPLWQIPTPHLMRSFLEEGFKAIIVCVNEKFLDKHFCGRLLDESFVQDLPPGVDVCGENGEYHSFVFDGPIFRQPVPFTVGETVYRTYPAPKEAGDACYQPTEPTPYGFYFCDLLPVSS